MNHNIPTICISIQKSDFDTPTRHCIQLPRELLIDIEPIDYPSNNSERCFLNTSYTKMQAQLELRNRLARHIANELTSEVMKLFACEDTIDGYKIDGYKKGERG